MYFTQREMQILDRMRLGDSYKEIAHLCGITEGGIKVTMSSLCQREGFNGPKNALALYVEWRCLQRQLRETTIEISVPFPTN